MTTKFTPRLDILPAPQRRLWDELSAVPEEFVLYGGTALALHLGHRESLDFDFFADKPLDPTRLVPAIPFLVGAIVTQREPNTFGCTVDRGGAIKLSFFGLPELARLLPPLIAPGNKLRVAALLDLAGTKVSVVQMRAEARDYIDIDALLSDGRIDLPLALAAGQAIFGPAFNPQITLKALSYFDDGNLGRLPSPVKDRLAAAARAVDLDQLPVIVAQGRGAGQGGESAP
jgi:Nucleotidyl transferase AbiEii toxin, Type IV TA system